MDLFRRNARFHCPPDMAVHGAFGADGCRRAELDQLDDLLVQRPGMPHRGAERFHGGKIIRVLLLAMTVSSYGKRLGPFGSGRTLQYRIIRRARR